MEIPKNSNRYGLQRYIPLPIRREVRQRCGFGCVICGLAIYDYEHFSPDFADAQCHCAAGITLLCPGCNQKRARGWLSIEAVAAANAAPRCLAQGFASEMFDFSSDRLEVVVGTVTFHECGLVIDGKRILSFASPLGPGQPLRMSAVLTDIAGVPLVRVVDNEWIVPCENWDVKAEGGRISILSGPRKVAVEIRLEPPYRIVIERCSMRFNNKTIEIEERGTKIAQDNGGGIILSNVAIGGFAQGVSWNSLNDSTNGPAAIRMGR